LATLLGVGIVVIAAALETAAPAAATSGIGVYVGYADNYRANATNFPTPWAGSPATTFEGCSPAASCTFDAGAVQVVNNTGSPATIAVAVHISTCTYEWPSTVIASGADLVVTQLASGAANGCTGPVPLTMDSSDIGPFGIGYANNCAQDFVVPTVDVTVNGVLTNYPDTGKILNAGGFDQGTCPPGSNPNESVQWTVIGHAPCPSSVLSLMPPSQTHPVGTTATVTAAFTNSCNQPLQNVSVTFRVQSGPNAGRTGTATTDASGMATFTYGSVLTGTDTVGASVTNLAGTISSNTVTVLWVAFAPGGGAFVISDLKDVTNGSVYWWGAQWWKNDHFLSGALAPASFKGYENSNSTPWCGQTWTTRPGNSPHPPKTVPGMMAVIVASHITKRGPVISGDIVHIVLVRTNRGYGPNPGHPGTGTIVAQLC
jgi:hypothetical protein